MRDRTTSSCTPMRVPGLCIYVEAYLLKQSTKAKPGNEARRSLRDTEDSVEV